MREIDQPLRLTKSRKPIPKRRKGPPRRGRVYDEAYLAFIRKRVCVACFEQLINNPEWQSGHVQKSRTEAAHVGLRGLSQKCSDRETIPLCREHHTEGKTSAHKLGKNFWKYHGIDRDKLIAQLNERYE